MTEALLTYRGTVYPWHCDHVGHMNVMWYVGKFDEATWNLMSHLGMSAAFLREHHRGKSAFWLFMTIALGFTFVACQAVEYYHAYHELNLKFTSGAYGSLFFMLTGFHGFHVILGATMLTVILIRMMKGHFTAKNHFGFEGAAWYWHFVDVVWLGLYLFVYWF